MNTWIRRLLCFSLFLILAASLFLAATNAGLHSLVLLSNRLTADFLTIGSASGSLFGTLHLRDIRYADGIDTVTIDTLHLTWAPTQLLNGQVHIHTLRGANVQVLLGESGTETILSPFSLPGILQVDTVAVETIVIFSEQKEVWQIRTGTIKDLSYQGQTLNVAELALTNEATTIRTKGQLRTSNDYPLQLTMESHLHPDGYQPVAARGTVNGPLNKLHIDADIHAPFPVHLSGRLNNLLGKTTWQARAESPIIALSEIHREWPAQRFTKVVIDGQGTLDDYALHLESLAGLPRLKEPSALTAEIQGHANGLRINTFHLTHSTSQLSAKGNLTWNPAFSWEVAISGTHLDPALFLADWPGDLTVSLTSYGQSSPQGFDTSVHLPTLRGTLRGFPLVGNGEIQLKEKQVRIPHLSLQSGKSALRINGKAAETIDLTLQFDSNNLAELWPGARGKITAQGRATGKPEKSQVDFKLIGSNVGMGGDSVQKLTMEAKGPLSRDGIFNTDVRAERLQLGSIIMDSSQLHLKGSLLDHSLEFESHNSEFSTGFALQGAFKDNLWQATLNRSHFTSQSLGNWRQRQLTPLTLSAEKADISPLCLASSASATLCANGAWQASGNTWQLHGEATAFPLELLHARSTRPWPLTGQLNAGIDLTGQQSRILSGKLSSTSKDMSLRIPLADGTAHHVVWKKNELQARYTDNRLQAVLESELTDNSMVHAEWASTNSQLTLESLLCAPINGSIQFRVQDLSPLTVLTDEMITLSGALHGQYAVSGTLSTPMIRGQMELTNGQMEVPPLGITLFPLTVKMTANAQDARLLAMAHSGKGFLRAESTLQFNQLTSGPHTIHLTGDNFNAAHLPGIDLDATPDLLLIFGKQQTEVRGTMTIPRARITSIDFHNATAPSSDMVVIDEENTSSAAPQVPQYSDISVVVGDDVHIDAYGLKGRIGGKLAIKSQPGRPQVGNGTLNVYNGSFTVYGRRLKIDLGRLLFTGGPLTNPGIELRSERKNDKVTTGVIIDGFLQRPEMHFYSTPSMEQSAIISNLLESTAIGGETRQETGFIGTSAQKIGLGGMVPYLQGIKKLTMIDEIKLETGDDYDSFSLVFGSWLTPDFYVSYGKDLVKESGSFNTRYTLGKGFYFLTETGSSHSGGDIKYEFEY